MRHFYLFWITSLKYIHWSHWSLFLCWGGKAIWQKLKFTFLKAILKIALAIPWGFGHWSLLSCNSFWDKIKKKFLWKLTRFWISTLRYYSITHCHKLLHFNKGHREVIAECSMCKKIENKCAVHHMRKYTTKTCFILGLSLRQKWPTSRSQQIVSD